MGVEYVPLHVHSDASLDGAGTVLSLVAEAKRLKMKALALTDHGTLANAVAFWSACMDAEIKPILGMEAYLLYEGQRHHITLLSLDEAGFNSLVKLDSLSHASMMVGGYPCMTLDMLSREGDGIYALTGCASSAMYREDINFAKRYVGALTDTFGMDCVGAEMMFVGSADTWTIPKAVSEWCKLPVLVTNDTHYPCRYQYPAHQVVVKARRGFTYDSKHLWLKSGDEIYHEGHKHLDSSWVIGGLNNTFLLADRVIPWNMKAPPTLPYIEKVKERLEKELRAALIFDVGIKGGKEQRLERLRYEFRTLINKGFLDYIYILWDIVSWAKSNDIAVGPGRGSGGGSYVLFLLGITQVDPIDFGLIFERFINPERSDYPDVDVDFEDERREEVLNYANKKWGTIPIATYSCYSHKSAIHDIARVLSIPKDLEIPASEGTRDSNAFETFCGDKPDALVAYETMVGQIRHRGKHAAGVIIPNRPVPIERSGDYLVAAWAEGMNTKDLTKVGIVKYDLLSLSALSQLKRMEQLTGARFPFSLMAYNHEDIFELFCAGDVAGIFQWSGSEGIRDLTMRIAPRNFFDLVTCNALYRPGALDAGTAELYPEYMKKPRLLHPRIDRHLAKTYGVICYQEQVMAVVAEVMGGDLSQADIARRLISKAAMGDLKWEAEMAGLYASFIGRGTGQGFPESLLEKLWHEIYTHSGYSYNLAHATTYTMISYAMAWYKVHFRSAFITAVLQYDKVNAQTYIIDAVSHGLEIQMPHVNYSTDNYELVRDRIFTPLSDVAFLGEKGSAFIIQERKDNGPYLSYEDFNRRIPKRTCNNRARVILERIGAFKGLEGDPSSAIKDYASIPVGDSYQNQLEILGYIIPSPFIIQKIEELLRVKTKKSYMRFAGFISKVTKKESIHGEYCVYNLSPFGSFWKRGVNEKLKVGVFVAGNKSTFGNSTDCKIYRITGE